MKKIFSFIFVLQFLSVTGSTQTRVQNLLTENSSNPIGLDVQQPRFSWQLASEKRNILQTAYEIRVGNKAASSNLWSSSKIMSDSSVHVRYKGTPLQSGQQYYWQVRVWDNSGKASAWSSPATFQMALLQPSDWKAKWIEVGYTEDSVLRPSPYFRKQFTTSKKVKEATAYITAHGLYEAFINGQKVGDAFLTPGWTSYNKRLQYQTYDVTPLLKNEGNAIGVVLGDGWYRGRFGYQRRKNIYGNDLGLLFQMHIIYTDGTTEDIVSDESWKSATGPIVSSGIYDGETYDARLEKTGWNTYGFNDADWANVPTKNYDNSILVANYNEPVKKQETFHPIKIFKTPAGELVADFGQNLVGWVQLKTSGKAGDKITLSHAEVLDKEGNFYTANLRTAKAQDTYILNGKGEETFEPHFTFHGFRYIKLEGVQNNIKPEDLTAIALYSAMQPTGSFTSSNAMLNQLQHNIQWGQKGNFLDVPTDCPQRDERLGWTGDAQVFFNTAAYNMQVENFFTKWLKDLKADQFSNGAVPHVIPNILNSNNNSYTSNNGGSAGWADVSVIIPWEMYWLYNDKSVLEQQYESMKAWVGFMQQSSVNDLWNTGTHYGDWLFYSKDDDRDGRSAITDKHLIAQTFFAYSTQLLINAAKVLGKEDDVATYTNLLQRIKNAFVKEYVTPNGRLVSSTQTAYVLALNFDMLPEALRKQAAERLVQNIKEYNNHITTGFLGTPYICHVLSRYGYTDVAYQLLLQDTYPSWLYPVKMGATTIWERWDGIKPDSTFQTTRMNSFNHYAYGAIGDWMYRTIAGLNAAEPGYKKIVIKPQPGGNLTNAAADLKTPYGNLSSQWKVEDGRWALDIEVPANTTATVYVPAASADKVKEGNKEVKQVKDIQLKSAEENYVVMEVGSGKYHFTVNR